MYPLNSRSRMTLLTISRDAPIILAISCFEIFFLTIRLPLASSDGEIEQQAGDPAIDIEQRQALDLAVGLAQATDENLHQLLRHQEVVLQAALEIVLARASSSSHASTGDDVGRARTTVDQAHFTEGFARTRARQG
jgi:hypothetical protein